MGGFVVNRLWQGAIVVLSVVVVVFILTRLIGDPVRVMLPLEATVEQRAAFEAQLGLDRPILEQFVTYVRDVAVLDFGESLWQRRPVLEIIVERAPATILLTFSAIGLAVLLAVPLGIVAALRPEGLVDRVVVIISLLGLSIPQFWLGLLLIVLFSLTLGWLPTSGSGGLDHLILPALTLALPALTRLVMVVRSTMIDELNAQYVKVLRAKGIRPWRVVGVHALRNSAVPILTIAGWELIRTLSGYTVVVETVFAWPGLGLTAIQAIERQDLILLQAIVFVTAISVVVLNLLLDVLFKAIDPRIEMNAK
ncbi:ABC transporter permease [Ahrensia marina]|uniref:ABC transporter permease n=1 Tax=Ahrensia marina TaxID=1514904 RepID=UPI0035D125DD